MIRKGFRARWHNRIVELMKRRRPRYVRMQDAPWPHPWHTRVVWSEQAKEPGWVARVNPGFCNGVDPVVYGLTVEEEGEERTLSLCDMPDIPLHAWRRGDAAFANLSKGTKVFLEARGAKPVRKVVADLADLADQIDLEQARPLVATDLYLTMARPSMRMTVQEVGTPITGQIVEYGSTYETSALDRYGWRARFMQAAAFPQRTMPTLMDILSGNPGTDDGEDRIPVATVFLIGPPGGDASTGPGPDWEPHVQHHLFWNVMRAAKFEPPERTPPPMRMNTGLPLADSIGNSLLSVPNAIQSQIAAALNAQKTEGQFYTI